MSDPRDTGDTARAPGSDFAHPSPLLDRGFLGVVAGNVMTLAAVLVQHWPVAPVLWIYWGQSVVLGIVNVVRILSLREFSSGGLRVNGRRVPETESGKRAVAGFFAFHYGLFHAVYAIFLAGRGIAGPLAGAVLTGAIANVAVFAMASAYPLLVTRGRDLAGRKPDVGTLMFYPYLRVVPMHVAILLASAFPAALLPMFIGLKTVADLGMHVVERRLLRPAD
jgi:hypothetical protein